MAGKLVVIIRGGIGNQLFCYAAGKALAIRSNAELILDDKTGYERDYVYQRICQLNKFFIDARSANPFERFYPLTRIAYKILSIINNFISFEKRFYIRQIGNNFDSRFLCHKTKRIVYIDGYWQSENYFKEIENIIREDLKIKHPTDLVNQTMAVQIQNCISICIHVRWFDSPKNQFLGNNIGESYYKKAILYITGKLQDYQFFVFSDNPKETNTMLSLPSDRTTFINHNQGDENAYADLWLMTLCKHFIIANSTFSWWGAWLAENHNKIVIAPEKIINGEGTWGFEGLIPESWILL